MLRSLHRLALPLVILLAIGSAAVLAQPGHDVALVLDLGEFESAAAALAYVEDVDWSNPQSSEAVTCTHALAATELRDYLCRLTGADADDERNFPIRDDDGDLAGPAILIGGPATNRQTAALAAERGGDLGIPAEEQGFRILGLPEHEPPVLALAGADRVGTLYAAYELLEELGVRWYGPGEVNEEAPRREGFAIPALDRVEAPGFRSRGFWAWEDRATPEFIEWMGRNRMNFWTVEDQQRAQLKLRGIRLTCGSHHTQWRFIHPDHPYPYDVARFTGDENKPADPYREGEYQGDVNGDGALSYSEVHPEWYGLQKGKRSFRFEYDFGDNICDSNEDGVTEFYRNLVQDLIDGQWRWADSINFWMFDSGVWCECEACQALGTPTDRNLRLVHRLRQAIDAARAAGRLQRPVQIEFLAYFDVIEPPTRPLPEDFDYDGCVATFFPIRRCYVHAFDDPACTELNAPLHAQYTGWATDPERHYRGQIFIGEYYNVSFFRNLPLVLDQILASDIPYFHRTGARHMHYMHAPGGMLGPRALTNWLLARMLWEPEADAGALLEDYFTGRYGAVAPTMRRLYDHLRTGLSNTTLLKSVMARRLNEQRRDLFPDRHLKYEETHPETDDGPDFVEILKEMDAAGRLMGEALRTPAPRRVRLRLMEDQRMVRYADHTVRLYDRLLATQRALAAGDRDAAEAAYAEATIHADRLRVDILSTSMASSHANDQNGLEASLVSGVYEEIGKAFKTGGEAAAR